jgi:ribonuclease HI
MKYLFAKSGVTSSGKWTFGKRAFGIFDKDKKSDRYYLSVSIKVPDPNIRANLEECYNFYNTTRHEIFHFGDIMGETDSTRLIDTKKEADELIKECLRLMGK